MTALKIRPIRIEGNRAFVTLTRGYVAVIDAADVPLVAGRNWCAIVKKHTAYAVSAAPRRNGVKAAPERMHRVLTAAPDGYEVDHKNGDGLNNTRANLRLATRQENACNIPKRANGSAPYKGITRHQGRWMAQIRVGGVQRYLGMYDAPEDAHAAYVAAAKELHQQFARWQ